jgi:hypothetical protein
MVRFTDSFKATASGWGGWNELEIQGLSHTDRQTTTEIIATTLESNVHMMYELGWVYDLDGAESPERVPTRLEAAKMLLKALGEYEAASAYEGTFTFADANAVPCHANMLSYIYAYKKFGIQGDERQNFMPNEPLEAKAFYKMLLCALGYEYSRDFTWETEEDFVHLLGVGNMLYTAPFTMKDMCNAMYEGFRTAYAGGAGRTFAEKLREEGCLTDDVWKMYMDKRDKISEAHERAKEPYFPSVPAQATEYAFTLREDPKIISSSSFAYNAPFHYAGIYYGTLPHDNPLSKRSEYAAALKKAGALALRFPGGTPAHQYFIEGERYAVQFDKDCRAFSGPNVWGGLYNANDYNNAWYVDFYDYLNFCKEYGITPIFQVTTDYVFIPSYRDIYDFFGGLDVNAIRANMNVGATAVGQSEATVANVYEASRTWI